MPDAMGTKVYFSLQAVHRAAASHAVEVGFDPVIINRDDIARRTRCSWFLAASFRCQRQRVNFTEPLRAGDAPWQCRTKSCR